MHTPLEDQQIAEGTDYPSEIKLCACIRIPQAYVTPYSLTSLHKSNQTETAMLNCTQQWRRKQSTIGGALCEP